MTKKAIKMITLGMVLVGMIFVGFIVFNKSTDKPVEEPAIDRTALVNEWIEMVKYYEDDYYVHNVKYGVANEEKSTDFTIVAEMYDYDGNYIGSTLLGEEEVIRELETYKDCRARWEAAGCEGKFGVFDL